MFGEGKPNTQTNKQQIKAEHQKGSSNEALAIIQQSNMLPCEHICKHGLVPNQIPWDKKILKESIETNNRKSITITLPINDRITTPA